MIRLLAVAILCAAAPAWGFELRLPSTARQTVERNTGPDLFSAPIGVLENGILPKVTVEGDVDRAAWRIASDGLIPLQLMRPLRAQLVDAGFDVVLDCDGTACGGFDFRFEVETLPGPEMYVNLRAYHVVTGIKGTVNAPSEVVSLLASTSASAAYVQIIHARPVAQPGTQVQAAAPVPLVTSGVEGDIAALLLAQGHAVLRDLEFDSGSTTLGAGPFASLTALANFMRANPTRRIALVGHTDTTGGLEPNITISRAPRPVCSGTAGHRVWHCRTAVGCGRYGVSVSADVKP